MFYKNIKVFKFVNVNDKCRYLDITSKKMHCRDTGIQVFLHTFQNVPINYTKYAQKSKNVHRYKLI